MKLKIFFLSISMGFQVTMNAQSEFQFENNNQLGLLSGSSKSALQLQTINGVRYKTVFAGIGVGVDNYYFKTIPLFADFRHNIFGKKETPFVYIDAGSAFPSKKEENTTWQHTTYHPGLYYDFGIGYKWTIAKHFFINASFGFSQKKYSSHVEYKYLNVDQDIPPDRYDYRLQRFSMKLGLGF